MNSEKLLHSALLEFGEINKTVFSNSTDNNNYDNYTLLSSEFIFENQKNYLEDIRKTNASPEDYDFSFKHSVLKNLLIKRCKDYQQLDENTVGINTSIEEDFARLDFMNFQKLNFDENFFFNIEKDISNRYINQIVTGIPVVGFQMDEYEGLEYENVYSLQQKSEAKIYRIDKASHEGYTIVAFVYNEYDLKIIENFRKFSFKFKNIKNFDGYKRDFIKYILDQDSENVYQEDSKNHLHMFVKFFCKLMRTISDFNKEREKIKAYIFIDEYRKQKEISFNSEELPDKIVNYFISALYDYYFSVSNSPEKIYQIKFIKTIYNKNYIGSPDNQTIGGYDNLPSKLVIADKFGFLTVQLNLNLLCSTKRNINLRDSITGDQLKKVFDNLNYLLTKISNLDSPVSMIPYLSTKEILDENFFNKNEFYIQYLKFNNTIKINEIIGIVEEIKKLKIGSFLLEEEEFLYKISFNRIIKFNREFTDFDSSGFFDLKFECVSSDKTEKHKEIEQFIRSNLDFQFAVNSFSFDLKSTINKFDVGGIFDGSKLCDVYFDRKVFLGKHDNEAYTDLVSSGNRLKHEVKNQDPRAKPCCCIVF